MKHQTYIYKVWRQFTKKRLGYFSLLIVILFTLVGIYAPILASSKPLVVLYDGSFYFPLFRYLFYTGFYTKGIDIFFNLLMFTFPLIVLTFIALKPGFRRRLITSFLVVSQLAIFLFIYWKKPEDPASDPLLNRERYEALIEMRKNEIYPDWEFELRYMTPYAKLNYVLDYRNKQKHHQTLLQYHDRYAIGEFQTWLKEEVRKMKVAVDLPLSDSELRKRVLDQTPQDKLEEVVEMPTLWQLEKNNRKKQIERLLETIKKGINVGEAEAELNYYRERQQWLSEENEKISFNLMPLIRHFHWEEDAGGKQNLNQYLPWWELTRINRKDLTSALIFGVRISLVVGILAVSLSLVIGVPFGAAAGYYAGRFDIIVSRLLEIWESMPTFFMLLLVVSMTQNKSIFLVIAVIGFFGWTGFSRYIRGEFFKQRNLPYVEACHAQGFRDSYVIMHHILPNSIPPILTLLPFAIMGAITAEAGLSFLGLGEEGTSSWGVLMDEGRSAFPGESYLLWPPAILLTLLLVAIALVGDALRDAIDPKLVKEE